MERTPESYLRGILAAVLEPWIEGLNKVNAAYQLDSKLRSQLEDPTLEPAAKTALIDGILPDGAPAELRNFVNVLITNNDLGYSDEILKLLSRAVYEDVGGPQKAIITSAVALTADEQDLMRKRLIEQFGSNLEFSFHVLPELLGGVVVQVGDKLIDDSVRGRIDALRNALGVRA